MPPTGQDQPSVEDLVRRLERERAARLQAETVAEQATTDLYGAIQELKDLNEALRDFVAIASHDVRAPLTSILGFTGLLLTRWDTTSDANKLEYLTAIERSGRQLDRLVADLLTVSCIEAGALDTQQQAVALRVAVDEATATLLDRAAELRLGVDEDVAVLADPDHLQRILVNYLTNAVKYGAPPIQLDACTREEWVEIRIRDRGEGVPPEFQPRLFGRFARAGTATASGLPGTGLGLSIVRGLAQANGGEARYEPNRPRGACFAVRLRRAS